jgi:F-type H+-transporting ATPase subunit b
MSSRKRRRSKAVLIDWFTVAAQALNFFILVWLMKRVLYKPIMAAIDARETLVSAELADAAAKKSAADKATLEFERKNENFERERAELLAKARDEAKAQGVHLLDVARAAADALQSTRRDALQREMKEMAESLGRRTQQTFFTLARRAFKDLANASLEEQMTALFCVRLRALKKEDKEKLSAAIESCTEPVSIRSAFALPTKLCATLQTVIDETFQRQIVLRYEVAPDLVSGIDLTAGGRRVGWSIAEYLGALESGVSVARPADRVTIVTRAPLLAVT